MSHDTYTPRPTGGTRRRPARRWRATVIALLALAALAVGGAAAATGAGSPSAYAGSAATTGSTHVHGQRGHHGGAVASQRMDPRQRAAAMLASAAFQDVGSAEAAGYASSIETLGCFQQPGTGGMGVHYINDALMDGRVDIATPEALVYELDAAGRVTGLVAHEYIVPIDAWTSARPPRLFGQDFHRHPTLPLWGLHAWLRKDNPTGVFEDWSPAVRLCPAGVPIFGQDRPASSTGS